VENIARLNRSYLGAQFSGGGHAAGGSSSMA
jgi:hypothetical protein